MEKSLEQKLSENKVSPAIDKKYMVVGVIPGEVSFGGKIYDLRTIGLKTAEELAKAGLPYLKAKDEAEPDKKDSVNSKK